MVDATILGQMMNDLLIWLFGEDDEDKNERAPEAGAATQVEHERE